MIVYCRFDSDSASEFRTILLHVMSNGIGMKFEVEDKSAVVEFISLLALTIHYTCVLVVKYLIL